MDRNGHRIDIVASHIGDSVFTERLKQIGINFFELSGNVHNVPENQRLFKELAKERKWDVLHVNAFQGVSLCYLHTARQEGIPIRIAHSHNTMLRKSLTRSVKMLLHTVAKNIYSNDATDLLACSADAANFLFSKRILGSQKVTIIPNGIDTQRFCFNPDTRAEVRKELILGNMFVVGNVGRLCYQKNQDYLLKVFAELLRLKPDSALLLVGDGEDKERLRQMAAMLGIDNNVFFLGQVNDVERLMCAMDVFVMPSRFEGLPLTSIEAQSSGLPCFFSDVITRECGITEQTTFLSLDASPTEWAETIIENSRCENRIDAARIVKKIGFDIETVTRQIESFYKLGSVIKK